MYTISAGGGVVRKNRIVSITGKLQEAIDEQRLRKHDYFKARFGR